MAADLIQIELVGGPRDGHRRLLPGLCPGCGEPFGLGHQIRTRDGIYVVERLKLPAVHRRPGLPDLWTAVFAPAVTA